MKKLFVILAIIALFIGAVPYFSSTIAKPFFVLFLESRLHGKIEVKNLSLSWLGPQHFEHVTFTNSEIKGHIHQFSSNVPFWKLRELNQNFSIQGGSFTFPNYNDLSVKIEATMQGPNIELSGETSLIGSFVVQGEIRNHILTLSEPFRANIQMSDELSRALQKQMNREIIASFRFKNPVTVMISDIGFALPLKRPLNQALLKANGEINFGQVEVESGDTLRSVLKIFQEKDLKRRFDIWFTPIAFRIENARLLLSRFDTLLSRNIHLCAWGNVNFQAQSLRMNLGIPADTLEHSFGIMSLSSNYVLKIPVKGTIQNPSFETGPAIAKITAMSASKNLPIGRAGKVFGGIVDIFTQTQEDGDVPSPKRPFPWEK